MRNFFLSILFWLIRMPARIIIKRFNPKIIAIGGSVGKTSAKEAIFAVLKSKYKSNVAKSHGNLNNELGLPLAILGFRESPFVLFWPAIILYSYIKAIITTQYPKILVLEYAADKPGDIDYLTSVAQPYIAVITTIGIAHIEFFKSQDRIILEKTKLVAKLPKSGYAVLNSRDEKVKKMSQKTKAKVVFYTSQKHDLSEKSALAIAKIFSIEKLKAENVLKKLKPLKGRLNLLKGKKHTRVIDDTYNANPEAVNLALKVIDDIKAKRKVAILGDMLELGLWSKESHIKIGNAAKKVVDLLILVGNNTKVIKNSNLWYPDSETAAKYILKYIQKDDLILVKGSRSMEMEKIVKVLKLKGD